MSEQAKPSCHPDGREHLPAMLRSLLPKRPSARVTQIIEETIFALENPHPSPTITFAELRQLMRDAVTTFRGLEDAAKQLAQAKADTTAAQAAAKTAQDALVVAQTARKTAEDALAALQPNAIPQQDVADGNAVLDSLAGDSGGTPPVADPNDPNAGV